MTSEDFEALLDQAVIRLNEDVRASTKYYKPDDFERRVFEVLREVAAASKSIDICNDPY